MTILERLKQITLHRMKNRNDAIFSLLSCRAALGLGGESVHNVKRAKLIRYLLERYPIEIDREERLVGGIAAGSLTAEQQDELKEARVKLQDAGYLAGTAGGGTAHRVADYQKVLAIGVAGILEEIGRQEQTIRHNCPEDTERTYFYEASRIALQGLLIFADRLKSALERLLAEESDHSSQIHYQKLISIFSQIPLRPARDFYEALQCVWLLQFTLSLTDDASLSGRPDQYLYPYYVREINEGTLDRATAMILIEQYYLKINELFDSWPASLMVGGTDCQGRPVYNELTGLFLQAIVSVGLVNPSVAVGYNDEMPDALLDQCLDILAQGHARPAFFNDRIIHKGLRDAGMTSEDARNYIHSTCVEITSIGCSNISVAHPYINMIKGLEFLLNDGREMIVQTDPFGNFNPGIRIDLAKLDSFAAFSDAYKQILGGMIREAAIWSNQREFRRAHYGSNPLMSCLTRDCIEKGKDSAAGGARYNFVYPCFPGFSSTVDALAAIREIVYEKEMLTLGTLKGMLAANFEGFENIRQYMRNRCPKYGNDRPDVDALAVDLYHFINENLAQYRTCLGGSYHPSYFSATMHGIFGENTAATADGRLSREALSECIGPVQGMDRNGPTAAANSIVKLEHSCGIGGIAANFRFSQSQIGNPDSKKALAGFIRTFMSQGAFEIQINVVDQKTLLDARDHPENHQSLIVRVAGYSDYFTRLTPVIQNEIIRRTEHGKI